MPFLLGLYYCSEERTIRAIFNMCFPYTSREEIANAVQTTIRERLEDDSLDEYVQLRIVFYP